MHSLSFSVMRVKLAETVEDNSARNAALVGAGLGVGGIVGAGTGLAVGRNTAALESADPKMRAISSALEAAHPNYDVHRPLLGDIGDTIAYKPTKPGDRYGAVLAGEARHSPAALAHEFGHLDLEHTPHGKVLQHEIAQNATALAPLLAPVGGLLAGRYGDDENVTRNAVLSGALPGAVAVPTLLAEAGASTRGLEKLRAAGAAGEELARSRRALLGMGGTYLGGAALGAGLGLAGFGAGRYLRNQAKERAAATEALEQNNV